MQESKNNKRKTSRISKINSRSSRTKTKSKTDNTLFYKTNRERHMSFPICFYCSKGFSQSSPQIFLFRSDLFFSFRRFVMPVGYLPIYNSIKSFCEHLHGVSIINGQVRIFGPAQWNQSDPIRRRFSPDCR